MQDAAGVSPELERYKREIALYEKEASRWEKRGRKIVRRYKDERMNDNDRTVRYNILYSNTQTILPAVYSQPPVPNIERRFKDDDDLGRVASDILERCVSYFVKSENFEDCVVSAVKDRLLPGRGTAWVRYEPHMRDAAFSGQNQKVALDGEQVTDDENTDSEEKQQEVYFESVVFDYVNWQDYGHNCARTWEEVWLQWRRAYLTKDELVARFGEEKANKIPLDLKSKDSKWNTSDDGQDTVMAKATIYELWDKKKKKNVWLHISMDDVIEEKDDVLNLPNFFCSPKPLLANLANDTLLPTPDFVMYQGQAIELDELTGRISMLVKALKVCGIYDASAQGVERMLVEGIENKLVPVEVDAMLKEKGGLKGVIDYFPIDQVANVLLGLYQSREKVIQDIYQITGISDIIRGASQASETATAQRIKGQFASLRLDSIQKDVNYFCRDLVRLCAFVIAEHFSIDTIKKISGVRLFTNQEKTQMQMMMQQHQMLAAQAMQMQVEPPPPPPIDDKMMEFMKLPSWEDVEALLRNEPALCFKVDIETNSTIKADQEAEQAARMQFLASTGAFIQQMTSITDPKLAALTGEMLMFGVRGFKAGRQLEGQLKNYLDDLKKKQEQPQQQPESPEMMKIKADMEKHKMDIASSEKVENMKLMAENDRLDKELKADYEKERMRLLAKQETETMLAALKEKPPVTIDMNNSMDAATETLGSMALAMQESLTAQMQALESTVQTMAQTSIIVSQALNEMKEASERPKKVTLDNGRTATVEPIESEDEREDD